MKATEGAAEPAEAEAGAAEEEGVVMPVAGEGVQGLAQPGGGTVEAELTDGGLFLVGGPVGGALQRVVMTASVFAAMRVDRVANDGSEVSGQGPDVVPVDL